MSNHPKEIKAKEWLGSKEEGSLRIKDIDLFAGADIDLKTITQSIVDPEFKNFAESNKAKSEYTNHDIRDAFEEYHPYPQWFYVFLPKNPFTAQLLYAKRDENYLLIEELMEESGYIQSLVDYGIFDNIINYYVDFDIIEGDIDNFLISIEEQISSLRDMIFQNASKEKLKYFKINEFVEAKNNFVKKSKEQIVETMNIYNDLIKTFNKGKEVSLDEFFKKYMPDTLRMDGEFELINEEVIYSFNRDLFSVLENRIKSESNKFKDEKKEKRGKIASMSFSAAKVGVTGLVDLLAFGGIPILSMTKTGLEMADTGKDLFDLGKGSVEWFLEDFSALNRVYNDFLQLNEDSFFIFLKNEIRSSVERAIDAKLNIKVDIPEETVEYLYKQFMKKYVFDKLGDVEDFIKDQAKEALDEDVFWIGYLLEQVAQLKPEVTDQEIEQWTS